MALSFLLVAIVPGAPAEFPRGRRATLSQEQGLSEEIKASKDPLRLVAAAERAERKHASRLLAQALKLFFEDRAARDNDRFPRRFAKALRGVAFTQQDVTAVLGAGRPKTIARQIFYRRYREQWLLEAPLSLVIEFDCIKGSDPYVLNVQEIPGGDS
jgi:hypothetical protein